MLNGVSSVRYRDELGNQITSGLEASKRTGEAEFARPWERMYVMQITRFIARTMAELSYAATKAGVESVPALDQFYVLFNNEDRYFRDRATWSIYRP